MTSFDPLTNINYWTELQEERTDINGERVIYTTVQLCLVKELVDVIILIGLLNILYLTNGMEVKGLRIMIEGWSFA